MSGEIDFDPFETQAFPGLEFFFSGDRDNLTVNAFETANSRRTSLLSIARQGFLIRHPLPGTFTPLPPDENGLLPLNDAGRCLRAQGDQPPQPIRFGNLRPSQPAPPRNNITPELMLPNGVNVHLHRTEEGNILFRIFVGRWRDILRFSAHDGRLVRIYQSDGAVETMRRNGFTMSRDGAIAITNQTPRQREQAPPEEDLHAQPPNLTIDPALSEGEKILALHEKVREWRDFVAANADIFDIVNQLQENFGIRNNNDLSQIMTSAMEVRYDNKVMAGLMETRRILAERAQRGGGEGGFGNVDGALARAPAGAQEAPIVFAPWEEQEYVPHPQERLTDAMRRQVERQTPGTDWPEHRFGKIVTLRAWPHAHNPDNGRLEPCWYVYEEEGQDIVRHPITKFEAIPIVGTPERAGENRLYRMVLITRADGTRALYTLTAALDRKIRETLAQNADFVAVERQLGGYGHGAWHVVRDARLGDEGANGLRPLEVNFAALPDIEAENIVGPVAGIRVADYFVADENGFDIDDDEGEDDDAYIPDLNDIARDLAEQAAEDAAADTIADEERREQNAGF